MNAFEFVIVIIALSFGYKLVAAWVRNREQYRVTDESANAALVQRLEQLEERVRVLERIVTDERFDLKQQFKDLAS
ncbi:MAG TPA: hypothetical protein VMU03_14340 [Gammaproteobacteria bacterium]|jgi:hypothetical protein|nr:hypothetical protein [Gammaproteobacteria bacterium]